MLHQTKPRQGALRLWSVTTEACGTRALSVNLFNKLTDSPLVSILCVIFCPLTVCACICHVLDQVSVELRRRFTKAALKGCVWRRTKPKRAKEVREQTEQTNERDTLRETLLGQARHSRAFWH
jgi:hypothetical protein